MKHLIVSLKSSDEVLDNFKKAFRKVKQRKSMRPHYEISLDDKKTFDHFVRNIYILKYILIFKPKSVYELAKITKVDVSNLNKVILFLEEIGALKVRTIKSSGRVTKIPVVEYDTVEFKLAA